MRVARVTVAGLVAMLALAACGGTGSVNNASVKTQATSTPTTGTGIGGGGDLAAGGPAGHTNPSASAAPRSTGPTTKAASGHGSTKKTAAATTKATAFPAGQSEVVHYAVPIASYPAMVKQAIAAKYQPVSFDGYDVGSHTYINAVFRPSNGGSWYEYMEMSSSGYQTRFNSMKSAGYRLSNVESYLNGGQIRYAGIWVKSSGPAYYAFHGLSATAYQSMLNAQVKAGYLPANVSAVAVNGTLSYTGLLEKRSLGKTWELKSTLTPSAYQTLFNGMAKYKAAPAYLNAYTVKGAVRFVALFASSPSVKFTASHGLTASALGSKLTAERKAGYRTGSVAGYNDGGQTRFLAYWTK